MIDRQLDILAVTETWLQSGEKALCADIKDAGFDIQHLPRNGRGGGVGVITLCSLKLGKTKSGVVATSFEHQEVLLKTSPPTRLVVIYRPGNITSFSLFLEEFEHILSCANENHEPTIICGDFNIPIQDAQHPQTKKFQKLLHEFGWRNIVNEKTHVKGGTLDLVLVQTSLETSLDLTNVLATPVPDVPDHFLVTLEATITRIPQEPKATKSRKLKDIQREDLAEAILETDLCGGLPEELEDCVKLYDNTLRDILDELAPIEEKTIKNRKRNRWWTPKCQELKRKRRAAERRWLKARLNSNDRKRLTKMFTAWKSASKEAATQICNSRSQYYFSRLDELATDGKATFAIVNKLLDIEKTPKELPTQHSSDVLVTKFNEFFRDKVTKIYKDIEKPSNATTHPPADSPAHNPPSVSTPIDPPIPTPTLPDPPALPGLHVPDVPSSPAHPAPSAPDIPNHVTPLPKLKCFQPVTDEDLLKIIRGMQKKSCSLDPMPSTMISSVLMELLPTISKIVNESLKTGIFPTKFKEAVIRPAYKGKGLDPEDLGSYRPISNLSFVSKIIEKCVSLQLTEHLETNRLLSEVQSAYRKYHSCETATLKVVNDLLLLLDKKSKAVLLLLDLSAAFDTVQHSKLLKKLRTNYGIEDTALAWFKSYLSGRSSSVQIGDARSRPIEVDIGVPQGSILGPILFIMYTKELQSIAEKHGLNIHLFADDTQIYTGFRPETFDFVVDKLQNCISDIKQWMKQNYLKLNASKTEILILSNKADRTPAPTGLTIEKDESPIAQSTEIESTTSARNLGIWLDPTLSMASHISKVVQACNIQLLNLWRIARKLPKQLKIKLVHSLIHSRLDYGNALLYGATERDLNRLQKIQNSAARFVYGTRKRRGVTQMRKDLHFLPIKSRITFKICLLAYKSINGMAPPYVSDLIPLRKPKLKVVRADEDSTLLHKSYTHKYTSTSRAFSISAPKLWNELPKAIRESESVGVFKQHLKTYLFKRAYC